MAQVLARLRDVSEGLCGSHVLPSVGGSPAARFRRSARAGLREVPNLAAIAAEAGSLGTRRQSARRHAPGAPGGN